MKKILCMSLAAILLASSITGCAGKNSQKPGGDQTEVAKGRYMEETVQLPFEEGSETVMDCIQLEDGSLELYTGPGQIKRYLYDGSGWTLQEKSLLEESPLAGQEELYFNVIYGRDKERYVIYPAPDYSRFYIGTFAEDKPYEDKLDSVLSQKEEGMDYGKFPDGLTVLEDGTFLMSVRDQVLCYNAQGEEQYTLTQAYSGMNWSSYYTDTPTSYITEGEKGFIRYDLKSGEQIEEIPFQADYVSDTMSRHNVMAAGPGEDFYICNSNGIHHMLENGTMWETVIDGSLNSLGMPSVGANKLFVGQNQDFYVLFYDNTAIKLAHYTYQADMPAVPSQTLTLYGLDLDEKATIRQAASLFQMENPDVKVELVNGGNEAGGTTTADTIRALNTELLSGNGADVLVLDGLPVESYIEKGILEDLSDMVKPMTDAGKLMPNIMDSFVREDGKMYQVPSRIIIPVVYGQQEIIDSLVSMETLKSYQDSHMDSPIREKTVYENIVRQLVTMYDSELVDAKTKELVPGKIRLLLETAKSVGEACGAEVSFDETEEEGRGTAWNRVSAAGFERGNFQEVDLGTMGISIQNVKGIYEMLLDFAVMDKHSYKLQSINQTYRVNGLLGVNKSSSQIELAKKFVQFTLEYDLQKNDLADGFPVNKEAKQVWIDRTQKDVVTFGSETYELSASYPSLENRQYILDLTDTLTTPVSVDTVLMEMIISETKGFFEGTISAEQAAQAAESKAKLYFAE